MLQPPIPLGEKFTAFARPVFTDVNPPITGHLVGGTSSQPIVTGNNKSGAFGDMILPMGIGVGKMIKIGPMPVLLMAEYQHSLIKPDGAGEDYTIMLQANFINNKNPFGNL